MRRIVAPLLAATALALGPAAVLAAEPRTPDPCLAKLASDIHACDAAVEAERDDRRAAELRLHRAYQHNERNEYEAALSDLDKAIALAPDYADAYHERAYTLGELSEYARAILDSDREVALRPDHAPAYAERAFARMQNGDLEGAYRDRVRVVELSPGDANALYGRGEAALWLGRFDEAARDAEKSLRAARAAANPRGVSDAEQLAKSVAVWRRTSGAASPAARCRDAAKEAELSADGLIGDCTAAILAARSSKEKADLLTARALIWIAGRQDVDAGTRDFQMAVAFDPDNAERHSNLGSAYIQVHHSWAAKRELDRALALDPDSWVALAGRAVANDNLRNPEAAVADAKRSVALRPNQVALTVLGDHAMGAGDQASAKHYWMEAYRLGSRDDAMVKRLKAVGVDDPGKEAKSR